LRALYVILVSLFVVFLVCVFFILSHSNKGVKPTSIASPFNRPARVGPSPSPTPTATPLGLVTLSFGGSGTGPGLFKDAKGIAVDGEGNLYVSDDTLRIQKFDQTGKFIDLWTISEKGAEKLHHGPEGLLADRAGNVYVIIGGVIVKYKGSDGERLGTGRII
jgi:sugar lactone lactonase YvrE